MRRPSNGPSRILLIWRVAACGVVVLACGKTPTAPTDAATLTTAGTATVATGTTAPTSTATDTTSPPSGTDTATTSATAAASAFSGNVSVRVTGDYLVVESTGIPTHEYGPFPNLGDANGDGRADNPNTVQAQNHQFLVPLTPQRTSATDTPMGPIGVATNGVPFYNPYTAEGLDAIVAEVFDACDGHPDQRGVYHYHQIPSCLVADTSGQHSSLYGFMLDGFGIYGPQDVGGGAPRDLDSCNGHTGPTQEHPDGAYHYHMTRTFPYLIGCYAGMPNR